MEMDDDTLSRKSIFTVGCSDFSSNNNFYFKECPFNFNFSEQRVDPQIPIDYLNDIYQTLLNEELENKVKVGYMKDQKDINGEMRAILIDWLVDVHFKFKLKHETLMLTVSLMDRFLSKENVGRSILQLVGVTCLMIACKYEEIMVPHIKDFVYITDSAYTKEQILEFEIKILNSLNYEVVIPCSLSFFDIISINYNFSKEHIAFGKYMLDLYMLDYRMTKYLPSLIANSVAYLVMKFCKIGNYQELYSVWNCNSNSALLKDCAREICYLVDNIDKSNLKAVKTKYQKDQYFGVANITFTQSSISSSYN